MFELMDTYGQQAVIKVIGVGGGGGNAVGHMVAANIDGARVVDDFGDTGGRAAGTTGAAGAAEARRVDAVRITAR